MMAICARILLFLAVIISKSGCHAFEVSIQRGNSLPVILEDFTLVCTFTPQTKYRLVTWERGAGLNTLATHDCHGYRSCGFTVLDHPKFSLSANYYSVNLTIKQLAKNDGDNYQCTVSSTYVDNNPGSTSTQMTPLSRAPPYRILITGWRLSRYSHNNTSVTLIARQPHDITCEVFGARPPAVLIWRIPDDLKVVLQDQSDVVRDNNYVSRKAATITPSRNDQGKSLHCVASHSELQQNLHHSVHLTVHVLPSSMLLFSTGYNKEHESESTLIYVQEGTSTSITCKSIGSLPAVDLSLTLLGDTSNIHGNANLSKYRNALDGSLFDTESTIAIHPERKHHGTFIQCHASFDGVFIDHLLAKLIVYGPSNSVNVTMPEDMHVGEESNVSCRAVNGYPASLIYWYIGSKNVTHGSSLKSSRNIDDRYDAESTLSLIPRRTDHGKPLLCQAVQPSSPSMQDIQPKPNALRSVNDSMVLKIYYAPVVSIISRRFTSNKVRPWFVLTCTADANPLAHIFTWFCNDTHFSNGTGNISLSDTKPEGETLTSSEVALRDPLSEDHCDFKCIAVSSYGSGSAVFDSTFSLVPDPPSRFFVDHNHTTSSTLTVAWQPGFDGGLPQTFTLEYCPNGTQVEKEGCGVVTNLTETSFPLTGLEPLTTYRMTLWAVNSVGNSSAVETVASTTALQPDNSDSQVTKKPSDGNSIPLVTIAIGVIAGAGFILLTSLGLMYFYGVLCCVKRKKDHGKHNQPEGQMVDQGEYAEIAQAPPSHASKSTTSDYMDLKPISRTDNDTTTSYYMDLKPIPRTDIDITTSDYMDLKPIPRTNKDTTTSDYMDLKPMSPTNNDTPTNHYMDMKPISPTDNDEYIMPSATRKFSEAVYVNRDMTDESALQNGPDNQDDVSPSSTQTCSEAVNVNTDEKASKKESDDPLYINTLPTAQEAHANTKTTSTYMNMYPIPPMSSP